MTNSTEDLIASLSERMEPIKRPANPFALFLKWLAGSLAYMGMLLLFFGLRQNLLIKFHSPLFLAELGFLASIMITSALSAAILSFPDIYQKRWLVFTPVLPLLLFIATLFIAWQNDNPPAPLPPHGIECLACITMFSLLPAAFMLFILRKQASTHYAIAGSIALISAASVGCLTLRLSENTDSIPHLVEWHYLPMIGFGILGLWVGRKLLKW